MRIEQKNIKKYCSLIKYRCKRILHRIIREIKELKNKKAMLILFPAVVLYLELLLRIIGKTGLFKGFLPMLLFTLGAGLILDAVTLPLKS